MSYSILTGGQIRAARALSRVEQAELAQASGLSIQTIKRLEQFKGPIEATTRTAAALVEAFRSYGVVFDLDVGAGPGLRLLESEIFRGRADLSRQR
jgi:transcriptional regulator with XRE-family HTH domain